MMFFYKIKNSEGAYTDTAGNRFDVLVARRIRNPHGVNVGYEEFASLEAALESWGLSLRDISAEQIGKNP